MTKNLPSSDGKASRGSRVPPNSFDLVGIGVSVWDSIMLVDRLPNSGAVVRAKARYEGIGGGVSVAMAAAARLGSRTALVDSLGSDETSSRIVRTLQNDGVDCNAILRAQDETASSASIWSETESAERTIVYAPGSASETLVWSQALEPLIASANILHLNGRHPEVCRRAIEVAKSSDTRVSFDGAAFRYRPEILPFLRAADIVIVARQFAESHHRASAPTAAIPDAAGLCRFLSTDLGCQLAGVTDGTGGSHLMESDSDALHQPAIEIEQAVDTTGCGDTFHGAILHGLAQGHSLSQAARFAAIIASLNARRLGALAFQWDR